MLQSALPPLGTIGVPATSDASGRFISMRTGPTPRTFTVDAALSAGPPPRVVDVGVDTGADVAEVPTDVDVDTALDVVDAGSVREGPGPADLPTPPPQPPSTIADNAIMTAVLLMPAG